MAAEGCLSQSPILEGIPSLKCCTCIYHTTTEDENENDILMAIHYYIAFDNHFTGTERRGIFRSQHTTYSRLRYCGYGFRSLPKGWQPWSRHGTYETGSLMESMLPLSSCFRRGQFLISNGIRVSEGSTSPRHVNIPNVQASCGCVLHFQSWFKRKWRAAVFTRFSNLGPTANRC